MSAVLTERILARKEGAIGWLVFNNPERRNAVSLEMWEAIPRVLADFESDAEIRVVVLAGAGDKAFASGADISQFEKNRSSSSQARFRSRARAAACRSGSLRPRPRWRSPPSASAACLPRLRSVPARSSHRTRRRA